MHVYIRKLRLFCVCGTARALDELEQAIKLLVNITARRTLVCMYGSCFNHKCMHIYVCMYVVVASITSECTYSMHAYKKLQMKAIMINSFVYVVVTGKASALGVCVPHCYGHFF